MKLLLFIFFLCFTFTRANIRGCTTELNLYYNPLATIHDQSSCVNNTELMELISKRDLRFYQYTSPNIIGERFFYFHYGMINQFMQTYPSRIISNSLDPAIVDPYPYIPGKLGDKSGGTVHHELYRNIRFKDINNIPLPISPDVSEFINEDMEDASFFPDVFINEMPEPYTSDELYNVLFIKDICKVLMKHSNKTEKYISAENIIHYLQSILVNVTQDDFIMAIHYINAVNVNNFMLEYMDKWIGKEFVTKYFDRQKFNKIVEDLNTYFNNSINVTNRTIFFDKNANDIPVVNITRYNYFIELSTSARINGYSVQSWFFDIFIKNDATNKYFKEIQDKKRKSALRITDPNKIFYSIEELIQSTIRKMFKFVLLVQETNIFYELEKQTIVYWAYENKSDDFERQISEIKQTLNSFPEHMYYEYMQTLNDYLIIKSKTGQDYTILPTRYRNITIDGHSYIILDSYLTDDGNYAIRVYGNPSITNTTNIQYKPFTDDERTLLFSKSTWGELYTRYEEWKEFYNTLEVFEDIGTLWNGNILVNTLDSPVIYWGENQDKSMETFQYLVDLVAGMKLYDDDSDDDYDSNYDNVLINLGMKSYNTLVDIDYTSNIPAIQANNIMVLFNTIIINNFDSLLTLKPEFVESYINMTLRLIASNDTVLGYNNDTYVNFANTINFDSFNIIDVTKQLNISIDSSVNSLSDVTFEKYYVILTKYYDMFKYFNNFHGENYFYYYNNFADDDFLNMNIKGDVKSRFIRNDLINYFFDIEENDDLSLSGALPISYLNLEDIRYNDNRTIKWVSINDDGCDCYPDDKYLGLSCLNPDCTFSDIDYAKILFMMYSDQNNKINKLSLDYEWKDFGLYNKIIYDILDDDSEINEIDFINKYATYANVTQMEEGKYFGDTVPIYIYENWNYDDSYPEYEITVVNDTILFNDTFIEDLNNINEKYKFNPLIGAYVYDNSGKNIYCADSTTTVCTAIPSQKEAFKQIDYDNSSYLSLYEYCSPQEKVDCCICGGGSNITYDLDVKIINVERDNDGSYFLKYNRLRSVSIYLMEHGDNLYVMRKDRPSIFIWTEGKMPFWEIYDKTISGYNETLSGYVFKEFDSEFAGSNNVMNMGKFHKRCVKNKFLSPKNIYWHSNHLIYQMKLEHAISSREFYLDDGHTVASNENFIFTDSSTSFYPHVLNTIETLNLVLPLFYVHSEPRVELLSNYELNKSYTTNLTIKNRYGDITTMNLTVTCVLPCKEAIKKYCPYNDIYEFKNKLNQCNSVCRNELKKSCAPQICPYHFKDCYGNGDADDVDMDLVKTNLKDLIACDSDSTPTTYNNYFPSDADDNWYRYLQYRNLVETSANGSCNQEDCTNKLCSVLKLSAINSGVRTLEDMIVGLNKFPDYYIDLVHQKCHGCDNFVNALTNQFISYPNRTIEFAWNNC